jgi:cell division control protein 45
VSCFERVKESDGGCLTVGLVLRYEELASKAAQALSDNFDLRSMVLVNCGAVVDVSAFLKLEAWPETKAFVVDYHRPVHLHNIHNASNVVVFADTAAVPEPQPERVAARQAAAGAVRQREPAQDDDDARNSNGEDSDSTPSKRRKSEEEEEEEEERVGAPRAEEPVENPRALEEPGAGGPLAAFAEELAQGSFYGQSGAFLMYELAAQQAAESTHVLWLAILGLTEHYLQHRCTVKQYLKALETLRQAAVTSPDQTLKFEPTEYHFVLHRHWSLYESMMNSPVVACRLAIWSEAGRRKLDQLFAKMGFPLQQCKQKFAVMSSDIKDMLEEKLEEHAPDFGLVDVTFPSFVKTLDNKLKMSAADCVHVVSALLDVGLDGGRGPSGLSAADVSARNFWAAYDALCVRVNWDLITQGLAAAVSLQHSVVREGVDVLLKKIIVRNGPFRYAVLHDSSNLEVFSHPLVLTRLALFLLDSLKRPGKPSKPLVVCALNRVRNTYLILGVTAAAPSTRAKRNDFGVSFLQAAKLTGATIQFHSFDSSVIEIMARDLVRFIELLHSGLIEDEV